VLDLRGNGGGYEKIMLEMITGLDRDSVVLGTIHERQKTSPLVARGGGKGAFEGQLYVLVDGRSASASELFARAVQLSGRGKVLGDRTSGAVMRAQFRPLSLGMETKVFYGVQVTEADVIMSDGGRLEGLGVTPDEIILPTAADLAAKRDPVLARALSLAGMPTDAAKAGSIYPSKP
jgi:carboxyl-terminal processing protease